MNSNGQGAFLDRRGGIPPPFLRLLMTPSNRPVFLLKIYDKGTALSMAVIVAARARSWDKHARLFYGSNRHAQTPATFFAMARDIAPARQSTQEAVPGAFPMPLPLLSQPFPAAEKAGFGGCAFKNIGDGLYERIA